MATAMAARDRLAKRLRGDAQAAFSVGLATAPGDLTLDVDGFGQVRLPVTPAKARKLIGLGQPARFGRGEQTLTDPDVRDTWEIPRNLVRATWDEAALKDILAVVREELGLPSAACLTIDLHSLLIYEPGQHFLAHQDSEKDDTMVGTLVVALPSRYAGGELIVEHNGERETYQGSAGEISLAAFYADCRHEVLPVQSGYRITLTYNLLMHGDTSRQGCDDDRVAELADLLREHFGTPAARYYGGPAERPPNRLVYLLDHEYTPRALGWQRLKGADSSRATRLRAAAASAGCEAVLALADLRTTHGAIDYGEADRYHGWSGRRGWDNDDDGSEETRYGITDLVSSEVRITHWTDPDGTGLEETSLSAGVAEVCASTSDGDLRPYHCEYEGYMGNWGNTLDRWYHRAAVVVWPGDQAFANRAEAAPAWALDELTAMASAGDLADARAAAATLAPFWDSAVRARTPDRIAEGDVATAGFLLSTLRAAGAVADAEAAMTLLRPFRIEFLSGDHSGALAALAGEHGQQWIARLLRTWFDGERPGRFYLAGSDRQRWVADQLPVLCEELHAAGGAAAAAAQDLLDLAWEWTGGEIGHWLGSSPPSHRVRELAGLGRPLASLLAAATAVGAVSTADAACRHVSKQEDAITPLEVSALRAAAKLPRRTRGSAGFTDLASDCTARLRARLSRPPRESGDWSIESPAGGCTCDLCDILGAFLHDSGKRTLDWPLTERGRMHVQSQIDAAELPITQVTRRTGRPYILVLAKTDVLFTSERDARAADQADLEWLTAKWHLEEPLR